jgi:hypothetical protein
MSELNIGWLCRFMVGLKLYALVCSRLWEGHGKLVDQIAGGGLWWGRQQGMPWKDAQGPPEWQVSNLSSGVHLLENDGAVTFVIVHGYQSASIKIFKLLQCGNVFAKTAGCVAVSYHFYGIFHRQCYCLVLTYLWSFSVGDHLSSLLEFTAFN